MEIGEIIALFCVCTLIASLVHYRKVEGVSFLTVLGVWSLIIAGLFMFIGAWLAHPLVMSIVTAISLWGGGCCCKKCEKEDGEEQECDNYRSAD